MRRAPLLLLVLAGTLAAAAPASAGTYEVNTCLSGATPYPNQAWTYAGGSGVTGDAACGSAASDSIGLTVKAGGRQTDNTSANLTFTAPAGTSIADWVINRRWTLKGAAADGTHRPFLLYLLDGKPFGGAGHYPASVRDPLNAKKAWAGYPQNDVAITSVTPRASWGSLAGVTGGRTLQVRLGCASAGSPCSIPAGGIAENVIRGARVTLEDVTVPSASVVASGLFGGGRRSGSDPIAVRATDGSGISAVQAYDVTDPAAPQLVATESYDPASGGGTTDGGLSCVSTKPQPCPNLDGETIVPTALAAGRRQVLVRVLDRVGNFSDSVPTTVDVATPSDRGALNGTGATETGTLSASFLGKGKHAKTVRLGKRPTVTGRLVNDAGQPIAGATLVVATRDASSERFHERGTVTTGPGGGYRLRLRARASRALIIGWRSHVNDVSAAARARLVLRVRAGASLKGPRSVPLGRTFVLRGRLRGVKAPGRVSLVAQGHPGERGSFDTFKLGRTDRKGRYRIPYRFEVPGSRGRSFAIRVRVLGRSGWPYLAGTTRTIRVRVR